MTRRRGSSYRQLIWAYSARWWAPPTGRSSRPWPCYIDALRTQRPDLTLTVVLPELIVRHRWQQLLHNGTARRLRRALRRQPGVVITTIPLHLAT